MSEIYGYIHSIESMSVHDGPGIRMVVYFQGCPLRCAYCHNPDTWTQGAETANHYTEENQDSYVSPKLKKTKAYKRMGVQEVIGVILRFRPYFERSGGGVTFSGGEVLMQPEFLVALLKACREVGIHTAIETSGFGLEKWSIEMASVWSKTIIELADLVILDVKDPKEGIEKPPFIAFLCEVKKRRLWCRYVRVPGISDGLDYSRAVETFANNMGRVEKIEPLAYHTMGLYKYEALGIPYPLANLPIGSTEVSNQ